jgi:hypothetical protein
VTRGKAIQIGVAFVALTVAFFRPARAGIDSLWMDDATLVQQLAELIGIHQQVKVVSDGVLKTAEASRDLVETYEFVRGTVEEVQAYGPKALWADFRQDLYNVYPGFELLDPHTPISRWKGSRTASPPKAYEVLTAVFGDLTYPLKEKERRGHVDTAALRLRQFEGAGALALAHDSEEATKKFDDDVRHLYEQAALARTGEEADVLSAKAMLVVAAQNSHIIRLLSRGIRMDGVDAAIDYGQEIKTLNGAETVTNRTGTAAKELAHAPRLMRFPALIKL